MDRDGAGYLLRPIPISTLPLSCQSKMTGGGVKNVADFFGRGGKLVVVGVRWVVVTTGARAVITRSLITHRVLPARMTGDGVRNVADSSGREAPRQSVYVPPEVTMIAAVVVTTPLLIIHRIPSARMTGDGALNVAVCFGREVIPPKEGALRVIITIGARVVTIRSLIP